MTSPAATATAQRLVSLDVFRGATVAAMLLVNNPGNSEFVYPALSHARWNGLTLADLVFPFFLFVVGITTHLSLTRLTARGSAEIRARIIRRAAILFAAGFLLNWFPFIQYGAIGVSEHPTLIARMVARLDQVRIMGVLQRIALAYLAAALTARRLPSRRIAYVVAAMLLGYWLLLTLVPVPAELVRGVALDHRARTIAGWVDRALLDWRRFGLGNHLWDSTGTFDPEGILSTLPAIATTLLGVLAGRTLLSKAPLGSRLRGLALSGAAGVVAGMTWSLVFPFNKNLWTSSYVLATAGLAALLLCAITYVLDSPGHHRWSRPLATYGSNPFIAFLGAELMAMLVTSTIRIKAGDERIALQEWLWRGLVHMGVGPRAASLLYALAFVAAWYLLLRGLERRRIYWRA